MSSVGSPAGPITIGPGAGSPITCCPAGRRFDYNSASRWVPPSPSAAGLGRPQVSSCGRLGSSQPRRPGVGNPSVHGQIYEIPKRKYMLFVFIFTRVFDYIPWRVSPLAGRPGQIFRSLLPGWLEVVRSGSPSHRSVSVGLSLFGRLDYMCVSGFVCLYLCMQVPRLHWGRGLPLSITFLPVGSVTRTSGRRGSLRVSLLFDTVSGTLSLGTGRLLCSWWIL